ncbi:MAG TPA: hypothetical protein PLJ74_05305 [Myxococcota bacterium]|nr:hypothetical protein [Myxococcota bacterium]
MTGLFRIKMIITTNKLEELKACKAGIDWFLSQKETDLKAICYALVEDNRANWANWLLVRCLTKIQKVQYAVFAAEQVIHIFEKEYPEDPSPRKAIEAAKAYIQDPSGTNRAVAAYAADEAYAASAAAYAAYAAAADAAASAAVYTASAAAAVSAAAAAYAADAAAASADAATATATATAAAAAHKTLRLKIIDYGLGLIEE